MSANPEKISTLADFTGEALIIPRLQTCTMAGTIQELSNTFPRSDAQWDAQKLNQAALDREQQMTTAMDFGIAFPHVRSNTCVRLQFALGRAPAPFSWGQPGSFSVQFVFLNAVPTTNTLGYLKLLSAMARLGKEPALLEQFKAAAGAKELMELLAKIPVRK